MKKQINEIKKMQRVAGLITESEYQESTDYNPSSVEEMSKYVDPKDLKALVDAVRNMMNPLMAEGFESDEVIRFACRYLNEFFGE